MSTTTRTYRETVKARNARIGVREAVSQRQSRLVQVPYGRVIVDVSRGFENPSLHLGSPTERSMESALLGAIGQAKAGSQPQRDLLAVWVAFANWKDAAK